MLAEHIGQYDLSGIIEIDMIYFDHRRAWPGSHRRPASAGGVEQFSRMRSHHCAYAIGEGGALGQTITFIGAMCTMARMVNAVHGSDSGIVTAWG
jgi:hypothetical protein